MNLIDKLRKIKSKNQTDYEEIMRVTDDFFKSMSDSDNLSDFDTAVKNASLENKNIDTASNDISDFDKLVCDYKKSHR